MTLTDQVIAEISRLLQVAIITGTDVVDNLRLLELEADDTQEGYLVLSENYVERAERNINKMLKTAKSLSEDNE
jgi:hypothetical protein